MVQEFVNSAYSTGHRRNLCTMSAKYQQFCELLNLQPFPAHETQLARYIAYLTLTLKSPKSIQNYVSAVKKLHHFARIPVPNYSGYLDIVMDGVKRVLDHVTIQAPAITPDMLKAIAFIVDQKDNKQLVIFTAMLLAFYLFLRSSNYVPSTSAGFDGRKQLIRADVESSTDLILVHIKWSKTIQFRQKKLLVPLIRVANPNICPVAWLQYMIQQIPAPPNAPLFSVPTDKGLLPLTYHQFNQQLKDWISQIGFRGSEFSSHGLRRGGASWAARVNISDLAIKTMGDWASSAYQLYINNDLETRLRAMLTFSQNL